MVGEMTCIKDEKEPLQKSDEETSQGNDGNYRQLRSLPMLDLDLNRPPCSVTVSESSDDQESGRQSPGEMTLLPILVSACKLIVLCLLE